MPLRVFDIRKSHSTRPRTIACLVDPAIDMDAMGEEGRKRYNDTLDMSHLRFTGDAQPTKFDIQPLTRDQMRRCSIDAQREADRGGDPAPSVWQSVLCELAFDAGCVKVHGVELCDDDGRSVLGALERERWDEIPVGWRRYIGMVILNISNAPVPPDRPSEDLGKS